MQVPTLGVNTKHTTDYRRSFWQGTWLLFWSLLPLEATSGECWAEDQPLWERWEHLLMCLTVPCVGYSCIALLGGAQFVFLLPKGGIHSHLLGFECTVRCHWDLGSFCVPEHLWLRSRAPAKSHFCRTWCTCLWQKHTLQRKKAFPRLHQLHKPVGAAGITVTHMSHFVCKLWVASPFLEEKAVSGKQGNLDLSPPWQSSAVPPGERQTPAFPKATVIGGIRDCCYNTSTFSGHESVCKVQFLTMSTFFQKTKKLVRPNPVFSNWIKPAF